MERQKGSLKRETHTKGGRKRRGRKENGKETKCRGSLWRKRV